MTNIHAKSNTLYLSVCVKYTTVLLQHVNSEMLMDSQMLSPFSCQGFWLQIVQGSIFFYWVFKFSSTVLRKSGILVSGPGKQDV